VGDKVQLFPKERRDGVFRGFQQGGLEFHADLALPYRNELQNVPMHGQFLLVQLENEDEAVLGRIASFSSDGKLSFGSGEEFNIRAMLEERPVPDDLREQYLRYRVNIRVLGCVRVQNGGLTFVPSHRRLPHVGAKVAFPSDEVLKALAGHEVDGAALGHFALGEFVYYGGAKKADVKDWMRVMQPEIQVRFAVQNLVSRRSFVFARAGFGKSNLNKLLFSQLYAGDPVVAKRNRQAPVGTLIFDPDGEYFWPDDKGRPALADVPHLQDKLVVFTPRQAPSPFYGSFVVQGIRLDIRRLRPADVIAIALDAERQSQQNVLKLKGMSQHAWHRLVDLIAAHGNNVNEGEVCELLHLDPERQSAEAIAARSNMAVIVQMLHDPSSRMMDLLLKALEDGKICVVDLSQLRGRAGLVLSGLILRRIFDRNQQEFTAAEGKTIPVIAVVEEAQSVLDEKASAAEPYVAWVKEGRKYDLGALLITQQPGSIPTELLSQGDNWFIFHLLSASDLGAAKRANAHFSDDLLSSLLNEPIPGQGLMWSSISGTPYPVPFRVASFELMYTQLDPHYDKPAVETYASRLRAGNEEVLRELRENVQPAGAEKGDLLAAEDHEYHEALVQPSAGVDALNALRERLFAELRAEEKLMGQLQGEGAPWGRLTAFLAERLPGTMADPQTEAFRMVKPALDAALGGGRWETFKHPTSGKTWARRKA
jgi:hypothetical protein